MLLQYRNGDTLVVRLEGELDQCCAERIRRELDTLLRDHSIHTLVLDLATLTFMDSSGIGTLLGRYRILRERGGRVGVINMNPQIARLFHMSGLDRVIYQFDCRQEAKA